MATTTPVPPEPVGGPVETPAPPQSLPTIPPTPKTMGDRLDVRIKLLQDQLVAVQFELDRLLALKNDPAKANLRALNVEDLDALN